MTVSQELKDAFWDELERQRDEAKYNEGPGWVDREVGFIDGCVNAEEIIAAILRAAQEKRK